MATNFSNLVKNKNFYKFYEYNKIFTFMKMNELN
jgi:hypothetical protein